MRVLLLSVWLLILMSPSYAMGEGGAVLQQPEAAKTMPPEPDIIATAKPFEKDTLQIQKQDASAPITFNIELAMTPQQQMLGMMNRTEMGDDEGMLFVFPDYKERSFWMKNTLIPLDILFFDDKGVINHIHPMAVPKDLTPIPSHHPAKVALEIKGGMAEKLGLKVGDQMIYSNTQKK